MDVMNIEPAILQQTAEACRHATEQTAIHIAAEIQGLIPELIATLTPEGPYAYTILPEVCPDGSVRLPVLTTSAEIREAYTMIRGASALLSVVPLTEIRGEWYTFQDSISRGEIRATGQRGATQTAALFPSGRGTGITGELVWVRVPRSRLGTHRDEAAPVVDEMFVREAAFLLHERYLDALRRADVDGVLETLNDGVASAIRDYVNDTGTLATLEGKDAHRAYYEALFDKYEIRSVEALDRVAEEWFIFAELRLTVVPRGEVAATPRAFNTAEFFIPAADGRFIARIGHGTDLA